MSKKKHKKQQRRLTWFDGWSARKKLIVGSAAAVVVLFAAASTAAYVFLQQEAPSTDEEVSMSKEQERAEYTRELERDKVLQDSAKQALDAGDETKAQEVYDDAVKAESDAKVKVKLLVDKSKLLYSAGKHDEAIKAAKDAEHLTEDKFLVAFWLARVYDGAKDYSNAIKYYQMAGEWVKSESNYANYTKEFMDRQVSRLKLEMGG